MKTLEFRPFSMHAKRALDSSAPAWAAEYEIAQRYFGDSHNRSDQKDLFLVEQQMFKEWHGSGLYGPRGVTVSTLLANAASEMNRLNGFDEKSKFDRIDSILGTLKFASDELKHYRNFSELRSLMTDVPPPEVAEMGKLNEGKSLTELRYLHRESDIGLHAVRMSESAGLSFFFGILKALGKDPGKTTDSINASLITITRGIIRDEFSHMGFNFHQSEVAYLDENGWEELGRRLRLISLQKLKERNEQCGNLLSEKELKAVERGENDWLDYARNCPGYGQWYDKLSIPRELIP